MVIHFIECWGKIAKCGIWASLGFWATGNLEEFKREERNGNACKDCITAMAMGI